MVIPEKPLNGKVFSVMSEENPRFRFRKSREKQVEVEPTTQPASGSPVASNEPVKPNVALAEKLENWAKKFGQSKDAYVGGLSAALRANDNLQIWASLNPLDYLPIPEVRTASRLATINSYVLIVRNVGVFAPVALTWIAVGEATTGFATYIRENSSAVVNFLDFWQNGYGILPEEFRISHVAELDAIIIIGVIVLTLLSAFLGKRATSLLEKGEALADRERMSIALEIVAFLFPKRFVTPETIHQDVAASVGKLLNTTDALESAAKNMNTAISGIMSSTSSIEKSTKEALSAAESAMTNAVAKLAASTENIEKTNTAAIANATNTLNTAATGLTSASQATEKAAAESVSASNKALQQAIEGISGSSKALDKQTNELLESTARSLKSSADSLAASAQYLDKSTSQSISETTRSLNSFVEKLNKVTSSFEKSSDNAEKASQRSIEIQEQLARAAKLKAEEAELELKPLERQRKQAKRKWPWRENS